MCGVFWVEVTLNYSNQQQISALSTLQLLKHRSSAPFCHHAWVLSFTESVQPENFVLVWTNPVNVQSPAKKKKKIEWLQLINDSCAGIQLGIFACLLAGFDTSILPICKDSLGWMFNKLDMNYDLLLDPSEISAIYLDKYEPCVKPLFNSCDSFKDGKLSNNEWCYCFQKPGGELYNLRYKEKLFGSPQA